MAKYNQLLRIEEALGADAELPGPQRLPRLGGSAAQGWQGACASGSDGPSACDALAARRAARGRAEIRWDRVGRIALLSTLA